MANAINSKSLKELYAMQNGEVAYLRIDNLIIIIKKLNSLYYASTVDTVTSNESLDLAIGYVILTHYDISCREGN